MANALYPKCKESLLQAGINMSTGTVKVALVSSTYVYSATHQYLSSLTGVVGTAQTLTTKTFVNGVFDAADSTFTAVTGSAINALVIYVDTGTAATSPLIAYIDTGVTGLPVTPNGGDISIVWNASGIFAL